MKIAHIVPFTQTRAPRSATRYAPGYVSSAADIDRIFDSFWRNAFSSLPSGLSSDQFGLTLDIGETEKAYLVKADIPGLTENDLSVSVDENVLTITGERKSESETQDGTWHRVERRYGSFTRSLTLPADADADNIQAAVKDGVLSLEIPRLKEAPPTTRQITVKKG